MARRTLYCLMDTETTKKNGMVFDMAYEIFDKHGQTFEYGSFLIKDVLAIEEPWYKEKIAEYWTLAYKQKVKPMSMSAVRRVFNNALKRHVGEGSKVVICAYNAAFDVTHMGMTSKQLTGKPFLTPETKHVQFLDLWHAWVMGCPVDYGVTAPMSPAGNIRTSAETVYQYISGIPDFEEKHMAFSDIMIEKVILMDILKRKKAMPIVDDPKKFVAMPWKIAQQRCRVAIEARKARQKSMLEIIETVPDLSQKGAHFTAPVQTSFLPDLNDESVA